MAFSRSCHCGRVTFAVDADLPKEAMNCNCSHCRRKGLLLAFFPTSQVKVEGESALKTYKFNKHVISNRFCETCGTQPFAAAHGPDGTEMQAINLRCVQAVDPDAITIRYHNGASA
jgi:hypothetical protein